jgi:hypothetical protein
LDVSGQEQQAVDIDLALEGSATKVSRLQARIKLCQGVFKLINVGRRAIFVNNTMVESGYVSTNHNNDFPHGGYV